MGIRKRRTDGLTQDQRNEVFRLLKLDMAISAVRYIMDCKGTLGVDGGLAEANKIMCKLREEL